MVVDGGGSDEVALDGGGIVDGGGNDSGTQPGDPGNELPADYVAYSQATTQASPRPVDIWVIDSSGSMQEEQNYLYKTSTHLLVR